MAIDQKLLDQAKALQQAAAAVGAANTTIGRQFYARDGWVWFGKADASDTAPVTRLFGRLFASLTADNDVIALNAVLNGAMAAKQSNDAAKAQTAYDAAVATLKQAAK